MLFSSNDDADDADDSNDKQIIIIIKHTESEKPVARYQKQVVKSLFLFALDAPIVLLLPMIILLYSLLSSML